MNKNFLIILFLIALAALCRFLPHAPNFTPIIAMALFGGAFSGSRRQALGIVFGAMVASDFFIGFHETIPAVYFALGLIVLLGAKFAEHQSVASLSFQTLGSALLFFVVTNVGVWLLTSLYPMTGAGLLACFVAAVPFFQNTLVSTVLYVALLFGGIHLLERFSVFSSGISPVLLPRN